jgi:alkylation response protein AidB-like acyl-CoA dehydrogenase
LLDGLRSLSGEKIQWYLAAELRDRIRHTGVRITVIDNISRKQYAVEPRQFEGRLLHQLPVIRAELGDVYVELYMNEPRETNQVALFRRGTRVFEDIAAANELAKPPWNARYLQGLVDAPFINLTPGTRSGIIHDEAMQRFLMP